MDNILVVIGVILSLAMVASAITLFLFAVMSNSMKYRNRKRCLELAVGCIQMAVGWWLFIGMLYAGCCLKLILDEIIV